MVTLPDTFQPSPLTKVDYRTVFILRLPFRVRVGTMRRLRIDRTLEVVFRNKFPIPGPLGIDEWPALLFDGSKPRPREELFTDVLILDSEPGNSQGGMPEFNERFFAAHRALNDAIVAYHTATNHLVNGLTDTQFFSMVRTHPVRCPAGYELTDADLEQLLGTRGEAPYQEQFRMDLADVSKEELAKLEESLQLHRDYIFYQFAFEAKSHMIQRNFVAALINAAIALEAVHAAVLRLCLKKRCDKTQHFEKKVNALLKDAGIFAMVEWTSLLLLDETDRPTQADIEACQKGITMRNEIVHAKQKKGRYTLRNRSNADITEAYGKIMEMYRQFVCLFEKYNVRPAERAAP